jgi:hypothetical protein
MLPPLPPQAPDQAGVFTFAQAREAGWRPWDVERGVLDGDLVDLAHGSFILASRLADAQEVERHLLAVRAKQLSVEPGWCAGRRSAALVHGVPIIGKPPDVPQLARDPAGTRAKGHSRHDRIAPLPPSHQEVRNGIATCTLARTVVDIARTESFRNAVVVADAAMRAGMAREEMKDVLRTMRRWPGVVRARVVADFADPRSESPGESCTRVACHVEGLGIPEPQVEVWRYGRFVARLDLLFRRELLAIEFDGALKFDGEGVLPALLARTEEIRDCGLAVVHTNWKETFRDTRAFGLRVRLRRDEPGRRLAPGVELRSTTFTLPVAA